MAAIIAEQFPGLVRAGVPRRLRGGQDHDLFQVGEWLLRFPGRPEQVPWLTREVRILEVVGRALGSGVPAPELRGRPSERFPWPFVGYRRLRGTGADRVGRPDALAPDIGRWLGRVHAIDPAEVPPPPGRHARTWEELRADLVEVAEGARAVLPASLRPKASPWLEGAAPAPPPCGPRRFIHHDMKPDHLLVAGEPPRLVGLIDWSDAALGDVVLDFVGLIGLGTYGFIERVAASYPLPLAEGFPAALRWLAPTLTLRWLAEAAAGDPAEVPKHLTWVRRALEPTALNS